MRRHESHSLLVAPGTGGTWRCRYWTVRGDRVPASRPGAGTAVPAALLALCWAGLGWAAFSEQLSASVENVWLLEARHVERVGEVPLGALPDPAWEPVSSLPSPISPRVASWSAHTWRSQREPVPACAQGKGDLALWSQAGRPEGRPDHVGLTGWWQGSCPVAVLTCLLPPTVTVLLHQGTFVSPSAGRVDGSCR